MRTRTFDALSPADATKNRRWTVDSRSIAFLLPTAMVISGMMFVGCRNGDSVSEPSSAATSKDRADTDEALIRSAADLAANGMEPDVGSETFSQSKTPMPETMGGLDASSAQAFSTQRSPAQTSAAPAPPDSPSGFKLAENTPAPLGSPENVGAASGQRELRSGMTAKQLLQFLQDCDRDMEMLARSQGQLPDPEQASEMMHTLVRNKLQAAIRLQQLPDADEDQQVAGLRGQLQSLSHLSAMGDLASAKALESLAKANLTSPYQTIASDSRIVLVGFAMDGLQAGRNAAAAEIVALIEGMTASTTPDVPAVLMMAQARQVLADYGLVDESAQVREKILQLYGNSSDAMIAKIAADAAGSAKFDPAIRLLAKILQDDSVVLSRWTETATELTKDSPDMNTVEFLATSALQLEAAGRDAFVEETFAILDQQFSEADSATHREIEMARQAMQARRDVIGTTIQSLGGLPTIDGKGVAEDHYKGKIILMPFWAVMIPQSLEVIPMLQDISDQYPDQIAVVGMNLDPEQAPLKELLAENELGFPSYRSITSLSSGQANPIAAKFGQVSLPFVAVFDQQGTVHALDFTGLQLGSILSRLLKTETTAKTTAN